MKRQRATAWWLANVLGLASGCTYGVDGVLGGAAGAGGEAAGGGGAGGDGGTGGGEAGGNAGGVGGMGGAGGGGAGGGAGTGGGEAGGNAGGVGGMGGAGGAGGGAGMGATAACIQRACGPEAQTCYDDPHCNATLTCVIQSGCIAMGATAESISACAIDCLDALGLTQQQKAAVLQDIAGLASCASSCGMQP
jgi:hypothetical protein